MLKKQAHSINHFELHKECLLLLKHNLQRIIFVFPTTIFLLTLFFWNDAPNSFLVFWLCAIIALSITRFLVHQSVNAENLTLQNYHYTLHKFILLDAIGGILLGNSGYLISYLPQDKLWILILVVIIINLESVTAQAIIKLSFLSFNIPVIFFFLAWLAFSDIQNNLILFVLGCAHTVFLVGNFLATHKTLVKNIELRLTNQKLALDLASKNVALENSQKALAVANRAKTDFIAQMSREIKTPLVDLNSTLSNIRARLDQQQAFDSLELSLTTNTNIINSLNQLIDVNLLESGHITKQEHGFSCRALLDELSKKYALHCFQKGLDFRCIIDANIPNIVITDRNHFSQIIESLLSNALKFTSSGNISIHVAAESNNRQTFLKVTISDTGEGIRKEQLDYIFQPFVKNKTAHNSSAKGLGLAVVNQLIQLLGGEIQVNSIPNNRTSFKFTIPISVKSEAQPSHFDFLKKKILIVEGNAFYREPLIEIFNYYRISFISIHNAKDAMAICAKEKNQIMAVFVGSQDLLQQKLLVNLTTRLNIVSVVMSKTTEFSAKSPIEQHLTYPISHCDIENLLKQWSTNHNLAKTN